MRELTVRVVILAILLTLLLAMSNAYLALKIGILTSASIPAAIISMGILRFFKNVTILENNLVQTAASAGEAVAGGIVYVIPALIIIHYWQNFPYWENVTIAALGGLLGVLFSIPIRRALVTHPQLKFPEGRAIASVLEVKNTNATGLRHLIWGALAGALIELGQSGFKFIASSWQAWFVSGRTLFGFGGGFSATMIGAGYLMGFNTCLSIFLGAILGWLISIPLLSEIYPVSMHGLPAAQLVMQLWWKKISYIGIGAMLFAGLWTVITLFKPLLDSLRLSLRQQHRDIQYSARTDRDIPLRYVILGIMLVLVASTVFFQSILPFSELGLSAQWQWLFIGGCLTYLLLIGFIFSVLTGYFSGLVGVSATPGSAIIIATLLFAALILRAILPDALQQSPRVLLDAEAVVIIIGAIVAGTIAIANDNIQDLKVGHLVGATPWKQQIMLMLGCVVSALIIPPIMELLFNVYGIGDVMPRPGMDPSQTLPAPPAALMAIVTRGVFQRQLPWPMLLTGMALAASLLLGNQYLKRYNKKLSVIGIAIGIYLPLPSSMPLFIGGLIAYFVHRKMQRQTQIKAGEQNGILLACGLIVGSVLMDILLAIPFSLTRNPDVLRLMPNEWWGTAITLAVLTTAGLIVWFYRIVREPK